MRYLFLRGNRNKRFFIDIANELSKRGHLCFQIRFELGELLFSGELHSAYAPWHISDQEYPISDEMLISMPIYNITFSEKILGKSISRNELQRYKRYMHYIDQFIAKHEIDMICLFNGYHWIDQISALIARKRGIATAYFEDGLFRPCTISMDPKGINANASIPSSASFYDSLTINRERLRKYLFQPENEHLVLAKENLMTAALVKGISMLGSVLKLNTKLYVHTGFWQSVKYILFKYSFKFKKSDKLNLSEDYIFLPFQVSRDTQIFYNSPNIPSMEALLDLAASSVTQLNVELNRNIKIMVKEHPEDMSRNNYKHLKRKYKDHPNVIFVQKYNTKELIQHALMILTVNSTVGIEALAQYKKVVTLGHALYNIEGIAYHCADPEHLYAHLTHALTDDQNKERIEKFLYYLRFCYQVEGSIHASNQVTAQNIANKLTDWSTN